MNTFKYQRCRFRLIFHRHCSYSHRTEHSGIVVASLSLSLSCYFSHGVFEPGSLSVCTYYCHTVHIDFIKHVVRTFFGEYFTYVCNKIRNWRARVHSHTISIIRDTLNTAQRIENVPIYSRVHLKRSKRCAIFLVYLCRARNWPRRSTHNIFCV